MDSPGDRSERGRPGKSEEKWGAEKKKETRWWGTRVVKKNEAKKKKRKDVEVFKRFGKGKPWGGRKKGGKTKKKAPENNFIEKKSLSGPDKKKTGLSRWKNS